MRQQCLGFRTWAKSKIDFLASHACSWQVLKKKQKTTLFQHRCVNYLCLSSKEQQIREGLF